MTPEPDEIPIRPDLVAQGGGLPDGGEVEPASGEVIDDPLAALLGGGSGGAGGLDFGALMEQASQMQTQMLAAQQQAAETVIEGVAGGGVVRIALTGGLDFQSVTIDPAAVDPDDVEMLQDLVLAALHHAVEQLNDIQQGSLPDLGGLNIGDLFGGNGP